MSYSRPSRIAPSAIRMSLMSSTLNTSARIASPPGNTGRRSSVIGSSLSSRVWPASIEYSMARLIPAGVGAGAYARGDGALRVGGGDLAVADDALAQGDASHRQALHVERRQPLADDELGAAPADVHHQALPGLARHGVRDARVDEPRLLHAGDDLDRMPERLAGTLEEGLLAVREAQRVRPHGAHAVGAHVAQPLAEALETGERPRRDFLIDAAVLGYPGREPHHLAQPIDDGQLAVRVTGHHHVKAVGT